MKKAEELKCKWYAKIRTNPEWIKKRKEYLRDYYSSNRDAVRLSQREYEQKNKETIRKRKQLRHQIKEYEMASPIDKSKRVLKAFLDFDEATTTQVNLKNRIDHFSQMVNLELQKPEEDRDHTIIDQFGEIARYSAVAYMANQQILEAARERWKAIYERESAHQIGTPAND